jgi:sarcosine oxidase delta subunit
VAVTDVHHCPYCELRFVSRNELEDHVAGDHPRTVDDDTMPSDDDRAAGS